MAAQKQGRCLRIIARVLLPSANMSEDWSDESLGYVYEEQKGKEHVGTFVSPSVGRASVRTLQARLPSNSVDLSG